MDNPSIMSNQLDQLITHTLCTTHRGSAEGLWASASKPQGVPTHSQLNRPATRTWATGRPSTTQSQQGHGRASTTNTRAVRAARNPESRIDSVSLQKI